MNKDLIKRLESIKKTMVANNQIDYSVLVNALNTNKHYRNEFHYKKAVTYLESNKVKVLDNPFSTPKKSVKKDKVTVNRPKTKEPHHKVADKVIENTLTTEPVAFDLDIKEEKCFDIEQELESLEEPENFEDDDTMDDISQDERDELMEEYAEAEENNGKTFNDIYFSGDIVQMYLKSIGIYPVLSREEEYELAVKNFNGDMEARKALINHNLRLVVSIAKRYVRHGAEFMDIIQYGNLGLMEGVKRFDPSTGNKLSTYATWWIKQAILRHLGNESRLIRMPIHATEQAVKNKKAKKELSDRLGREPSDEEVVDFINENKLFISKSITKITLADYRLFNSMYEGTNIVSLNTPISSQEDKDESYLMDFIPATEKTPEEESMDNALKESLLKVMKQVLTEKEYNVLCYRFGIIDNKNRTLKDVGLIYDVSRERIRQIEGKALRKLRRSPIAWRALRDFVEAPAGRLGGFR